MKTCVLTLVSVCGLAAAQPTVPVAPIPTPIVPGGLDIRGLPFLAPGDFPVSVQASRIPVIAFPGGGELDGVNSNYVRFDGIPFGDAMSGATNEGDIDLNISLNPMLLDLGDPRAPFAFPNVLWDPIKGEQASFPPSTGGEPTYAWAVTQGAGVILMQVANNGRDNGFEAFGELTGTLYAHAHPTPNDFRGGAGYNMLTGEFSNGNGTIYTSINAVGLATEYVADVAYAWFSFQEGWLAGTTVGGSPVAWAARTVANDPNTGLPVNWPSRGPDLPDDASLIITLAGTGNAEGTFDFAGAALDVTPANAMLFVQWASDSNDAPLSNIVEVGSTWNFAFRKDNFFPGSGLSEFTPASSSDLCFVALPYATTNLQGGKADAQGNYVLTADDNTTTIVRTAVGTYELSVPGAADESGMLLLQPLLSQDADPTDPNRNFMSYEYDAARNVFVIESRILDEGDNVFLESYPLIDSPFYVAYVDFANKPALACAADLDADGDADADDFFAFLDAFAAGNFAVCDIDADGDCDADDFFAYLDRFASGC